MRLYYGGYGHHPSGKQYVYWGGDNYRTGQNVVAPVTNKDTGKTYNTMFTIMRTSGETSQMAQNEANRLEQTKDINIKTIGGRDLLGELPSGQQYESKAEWARASEQKYTENIRQRLLGSNNSNAGTALARGRLLGRI